MKANEFLFIAGMLSANKEGEIIGKQDFDAQCTQVFANIEAALNSAGAGFSKEGKDLLHYSRMLRKIERPNHLKTSIQ